MCSKPQIAPDLVDSKETPTVIASYIILRKSTHVVKCNDLITAFRNSTCIQQREK